MKQTALICFALVGMACGTDDARPVADGGHVSGEKDVEQDQLVVSDATDAVTDAPDPTFCTRSSGCYILPEDCCRDDCSREFLITKNSAAFQGYGLLCLERGCTPCRVSARWVPQCIQDRCTIVDLDTSPISACQADSDCKLRWGTVCCEKCRPNPAFDLVSVSRSATFCVPEDGCDPCLLPPFPAGAQTVCAGGHCKVQQSSHQPALPTPAAHPNRPNEDDES